MSDTIHLVLFPSKSHAILRAECTRAPRGPSAPARPSTSLFVAPGPPNAARMGGPAAVDSPRLASTLLDQASLRRWGGKGGQAAQQQKRTPGHAASTGTSASAGVRQQASAARIARTTQALCSLQAIRGRFGSFPHGRLIAAGPCESTSWDPFDRRGTALGRRMSDDDWDTGERAVVHRTVFDHASLHVHVHVHVHGPCLRALLCDDSAHVSGRTQTPTS